MPRRVKRALAATAVVAGMAVTFNGCAIIGTIDFAILFRPTGFAQPVACDVALVSSVRFQFFDQALDGLLRTEVTRVCRAGERYKVSIDLGPYEIRVQGLNAQQTICYEVKQLHTVEGGKTEMFDLIAEQHPTGASGGCTYPGAPAP